MFQLHLGKVDISDDVDIEELVKISDGYSGADLENICRDGTMIFVYYLEMNLYYLFIFYFFNVIYFTNYNVDSCHDVHEKKNGGVS